MRLLSVGTLVVILGVTSAAHAASLQEKFGKQIAKRAISGVGLTQGKFKRLCLYTGGDVKVCNRRVGILISGTFQGDTVVECAIPAFTPDGAIDLNAGVLVCNDAFIILP